MFNLAISRHGITRDFTTLDPTYVTAPPIGLVLSELHYIRRCKKMGGPSDEWLYTRSSTLIEAGGVRHFKCSVLIFMYHVVCHCVLYYVHNQYCIFVINSYMFLIYICMITVKIKSKLNTIWHLSYQFNTYPSLQSMCYLPPERSKKYQPGKIT